MSPQKQAIVDAALEWADAMQLAAPVQETHDIQTDEDSALHAAETKLLTATRSWRERLRSFASVARNGRAA